VPRQILLHPVVSNPSLSILIDRRVSEIG
jgi:hypothetical protein